MIVSLRGWKRYDRDVKLGARTVLTAANNLGKSAVLDALRFIALGYIPALGKREMDTGALVRDNSATIRLTLDDGRWVERTIERTGKAWHKSCDCSWLARGATQDQISTEITALFGGEAQEIAERLDTRALLTALTPGERSKRLQRLLDTATQKEKYAPAICRLAMSRLADVDESKIPAIGELRDGKDYRAILRPLIPGSSDNTRQYAVLAATVPALAKKLDETGLQESTSWINECKKEANTKQRSAKAALGEISTRLETLPAPAPERVVELEAERSKLEQKLGAAKERVRVVEQQYVAATIAKRRLAEARTASDAAAAAFNAHAEKVSELPALKARVAELEAELAVLVAPALPDDAEARLLTDQAAAKDKEAAAVDVPDLISIGVLEHAVTALAERVSESQKSPWARVEAIGTEISTMSVGNGERATRLRAVGEELRKIAAANGGELTALLGRLAEAEEKLGTARAQAVLAEQHHDLGMLKRSKLQAEAAELRKKAVALSTSNREGFSALFHSYSDIKDTRTGDLTIVRSKISKTEAEHSRLASVCQAAQKTLDLSRQHAADIGEPDSVTEDTVETETKLAAVTADLRTLQAAESTRNELDRLRKDLERRDDERAVFEAIEWGCLETRKRALTAAGGPLLAAMSEVFTAAGRDEIPYMEAAELGWIADGRRIKAEALSGSGWVLFCMALVAAMQSLADCEIRLGLSEGAELDDQSLRALLAGVGSAKSLTHAVVASWHAPEFAPGWEIVTLEPSAEQRAA